MITGISDTLFHCETHAVKQLLVQLDTQKSALLNLAMAKMMKTLLFSVLQINPGRPLMKILAVHVFQQGG